MLDFLQASKQITDYESLIDLAQETNYKIRLNTFIKEIPPNFLSFYNKGVKRKEVEKHLKSIYGLENVDGNTVDIVLKRVLNLARLHIGGRGNYENKLIQIEYKRKNWNKITRCQICGNKFQNWEDASLDHVLPISLGGVDDSSNWQLLCKRCNNDKSSLFGISNINRSYVISDWKIFKCERLADQLDCLPRNYRYLVMEKDNRKCQECPNDNTNRELCVTVRNKNEITSFDNLYTLCNLCFKDKNLSTTEKL